MLTNRNVLRIAAIADLHCDRNCEGAFQKIFASISDRADVLLLCGDLADHGLPEEARVLAKEIAAGVKVPVLGVLGNHDFESETPGEVKQILTDAGVVLLDGQSCEIGGIGFAGAKGFCGGFGPYALQAWGESCIKAFVREAVEEALKLESALSRLETATRVVLLHYAPILSTVEGEVPALLPFLGSSRMEEPLNRYPVTAVFHGHAHHGQPDGRTSAGVPVYNVAAPVLLRSFPDQLPFRVIELPTAAPTSASAQVAAA